MIQTDTEKIVIMMIMIHYKTKYNKNEKKVHQDPGSTKRNITAEFFWSNYMYDYYIYIYISCIQCELKIFASEYF